jgi:hypothetical protein
MRGAKFSNGRPPRLLVLIFATLALALASLNGAVAFLGDTEVFPLSPFNLEAKVNALERYALHRPRCVLTGHPALPALVTRVERNQHLPPGLLMAILQTESAGQPHRISASGAMGVAQLIPGTARLLGVEDPFDSEAAVDGAGRYLRSLLAQFHDVRLAVAAYNAGPGSVVNRTIPRNGETEYYVPRVMARYAQLAPAQLRSYAPTVARPPHAPAATPEREPSPAGGRPQHHAPVLRAHPRVSSRR